MSGLENCVAVHVSHCGLELGLPDRVVESELMKPVAVGSRLLAALAFLGSTLLHLLSLPRNYD